MSYGLRSFTSGGEWVINETQPILHYVASATYYTTNGDGVSAELVDIYRVTAARQPFVLLRIASGNSAGVGRVYLVSGTTWEIEVVGTPAAVLCYMQLDTEAPLSSYGVRVLSGSSKVLFDSTRAPLWASELFSIAGSNAASPNVAALPGAITLANTYSSPAITAFSAGNHFRSIGQLGNPGTITNDFRRLGWQRTTTGYTPVWIVTAAGDYEVVTVNYNHHASGVSAHTVMVAETAGV
jgi:hypothetical protein